MRIEFYLSSNSRLRYASSAMLYFAQGLPYGLLSIAIPAWLASRGLEAGAIASYLAIIILPITIAFFFTQRSFIEGISLTGLKG